MLYLTYLKIICGDKVNVLVRGNIPFYADKGATVAILSGISYQYFHFDIEHSLWVTKSGKTGDGFVDAISRSVLPSEKIREIFQEVKWEIMLP